MGVTLYSRIPQIVAQMPAKADLVVQKTALDIEATAKGLAAVDTGAMMSSIQAQPTGQMSAVVNCGVEYGIYVEYGTYKMAAQPFMVPATEAHRGPFYSALAQAIVS